MTHLQALRLGVVELDEEQDVHVADTRKIPVPVLVLQVLVVEQQRLVHYISAAQRSARAISDHLNVLRVLLLANGPGRPAITA